MINAIGAVCLLASIMVIAIGAIWLMAKIVRELDE